MKVAGNWVVRLDGEPNGSIGGVRPWVSERVSFFEARRIAKRAAGERKQVARICSARGRRADAVGVEVYYPDGRIERPGDGM